MWWLSELTWHFILSAHRRQHLPCRLRIAPSNIIIYLHSLYTSVVGESHFGVHELHPTDFNAQVPRGVSRLFISCSVVRRSGRLNAHSVRIESSRRTAQNIFIWFQPLGMRRHSPWGAEKECKLSATIDVDVCVIDRIYGVNAWRRQKSLEIFNCVEAGTIASSFGNDLNVSG